MIDAFVLAATYFGGSLVVWLSPYLYFEGISGEAVWARLLARKGRRYHIHAHPDQTIAGLAVVEKVRFC